MNKFKLTTYIFKNFERILREMQKPAGPRYQGYLFGEAKQLYSIYSMLNKREKAIDDAYDYIVGQLMPDVLRDGTDPAIISEAREHEGE